MNKINQLFQNNKDRKLLSLYFCAGCPTLESTTDVILTLQRRGIDMIEVGIPFSDPLADGPVIQSAATQALKNGMTLKLLFDQLKSIKDKVQIPLVLMGYLNPILHYGFREFAEKCHDIGIDGLIIPDLPFREYEEHYRATAQEFGLHMIMLITPETEPERIRRIDADSDGGFIYMVSSASVTGAQKEFDARKQEYFARIDGMHLRRPRMIGFGISNVATYQAAAAHASGVIIGSRFVTLLNSLKDPDKAIATLKKDIGRA